MCTAATYKTADFYFGRTLDYEFSYGDEVAVLPRNYALAFRHMGTLKAHYAIIGMAYVLLMYLMLEGKCIIPWQDCHFIPIGKFIIQGTSKIKICCLISCCCTHLLSSFLFISIFLPV